MTKENNITVPRWFLENVENTLRIQNNINLDKEIGETCQDRNIRQSLNGLRKLLKGEKLTGMERFEKLQSSLSSSLDEAAIDAAQLDMQDRQIMEATNDERLRYSRIFRRGFKAGAQWRDTQIPKLPDSLDEAAEYSSLEYSTKLEEHGITASDSVHYRAGFKDGAEWLAGQGETRDDIIVTEDFDNKAHIFPIPSSEFNPGDRVIVQIRKKQQ